MAENKAVGYESMLDDMNAIITEAKPGMRGYVKVDLERLSSLIFEMRTTIPDQILQARRIATERVSIIQNAQTKANTMVQQAQESADAIVADAQKQAEEMIEQDQITRGARMKADTIVQDAKKSAEQITTTAQNDAAKLISKTEKWCNDLQRVTRQYVGETVTRMYNFLNQTADGFGEVFDGVMHHVTDSIANSEEMINKMRNHNLMEDIYAAQPMDDEEG